MATEIQGRFWSAVIVFLAVVIVIGGLVIWSKYQPVQPVEIRLAPRPELQGQVYAGGAVNNPGIYPLREGDSLQDLLRAAGGTTADADLNRLRLFIPTHRRSRDAAKGEPEPRRLLAAAGAARHRRCQGAGHH